MVARLRRVVGDGVLVTNATGYSLTVPVDASLVEVELARTSDDPDAIGAVAERWAGPSLAEFAHEPWAAGSAARLDVVRSSVIEMRAEALVQHGRTDEAIGVLEAHVAEHPFRDHPRGLLMRALAAAGRRTEALRAYQSYRSFLAEEAGLEPSAALREIEREVAEG
jgi:DNA-binding SARP family transcriptional activator